MTKIHTLDLNFQGIPKTIGVYLITHKTGGALIECGPGATVETLVRRISAHGLSPTDITDVFLTHIHLDHAGSAGWWARQGARIHVHVIGAPHLIDPKKLLASAERIYGDQMGPLWGDFLPVPEEKIKPIQEDELIQLGDIHIKTLDTPGHAKHHISYISDGICFCGDVGGVRIKGIPFVRVPTVPPEFDPKQWRCSIQKFRKEDIRAIAPTHYGIHSDPEWHLNALEKSLEEIDEWMEQMMPSGFSIDEIRQEYIIWMEKQAISAGLSQEELSKYNLAISSQMSADGIYRYWTKSRTR
jgi:glyoxylase-like metal-dependent hydrolase (beta-lactamase superfamily II)